MNMRKKEAIERALEAETRIGERQALLKQLWQIQRAVDPERGTTMRDSGTINETPEPAKA